MRVVFVGPNSNPIPSINGGAIETLVTSLIEQNDLYEDFQFFVFTPSFPNLVKSISKYKNTKFIVIKKTFLSGIYDFCNKVLRKLFRKKIAYKNYYMYKINKWLELNKESYDDIVLECASNEACQIKKIKNKKIYYHIHSDYLKHSTFGINEILKNTDKFIAVSEFIKKQLLLINGIKPENVLVLKNAIDIEQKKYSAAELSELKLKLGLGNDDFILLYCGRLSPEKGCLELIKAKNKIENTKLIVLGGENFGSNYVTPYVKQLYECADENVIFTGYVSHEEIYKYYSIANVGIVPSVCNEAASLTILEFRAAGLATIATRIGGIPEYSDCSTSIYVDFDDGYIDHLSKAIENLKNDRYKLEMLSKNSNKALDYYSYKSFYMRFKEMLT